MLHACVQRFDVTGNLEKFCKILMSKESSSPQESGLQSPEHNTWLKGKIGICRPTSRTVLRIQQFVSLECPSCASMHNAHLTPDIIGVIS